jgi:hypothetical protein
MILQRLKRSYEDSLSLALGYYSILSVLNNLRLTEREIALVAQTSIVSISVPAVKKQFCGAYNTTPATINNMISKLKKMYLLTKIDKKICVNPLIQLNFDKDVKLEISLVFRQAPDVVSEKLPD